MIPQAFIQDLLARLDVVEVVGRVVKLRKAGANMLGLCPFHNEKSPSFTVSPAKQFYHCFGCQAHGSAIGFVMAYQGLGYVEAIESLAQSVGMVVPREPGRAADEAARRQAPGLLASLEQAARFYERTLRDSDRAIAYLKGRGLSGRTAKRFALGYAPPGWRNLEAMTADYDDARWVEAGLVQAPDDEPAVTGDDAPAFDEAPAPVPVGTAAPADRSPGGGRGRRRRRYDRFRDRIIFPIRNARGAVIGFGARVLDRGEPKYLNSPETPVFSKGHELYGLYESRQGLRARNQAIVVEGYMDVVMLAEHGVDNAVATLGTATTPDHVRKLLRQVDHLVFGFDGDAAGRKAAWRALEACLPMLGDTSRVDFLFFPEGEDPDSYVRGQGEAGLRALIGSATPLSSFLLDSLAVSRDLTTPEGRAAYLAAARPLLNRVRAEALRMQLCHAVSDRTGVGLSELERYLAAEEAAHGRGQGGPASRGDGPAASDSRAGPPERRPGRGASAGGAGGPGRRTDEGQRRRPVRPRAGRPSLERRLRLLALCHPVLAREVLARDDADALLEPALREWFAALAEVGEGFGAGACLERMPESLSGPAAEASRDLAEQWGGVPLLGAEEARSEFEAAMHRLADRALRRAAEDLAAEGLADPESRALYQQLLASRRSI